MIDIVDYLPELNFYIIYTQKWKIDRLRSFKLIQFICKDISIITNINSARVGEYPPSGDYPSGNEYLDWGVYKIKAPYFWSKFISGTNVRIVNLDTGIAPHDYLKVSAQKHLFQVKQLVILVV